MLKDIVKSSGETQRVWASRLDVTEAYLSRLLSGTATPSLDLAVRIERATGGAVVPSSWLAVSELRKAG